MRLNCNDCGKPVGKEYWYMLINDLWKKYVPEDGFMCIGCLEKRIGRTLNQGDFDFGIPCNRMPTTKLLETRRTACIPDNGESLTRTKSDCKSTSDATELMTLK